MVSQYAGRLTLVQGEFSNIDALLAAAGETGTDGVVLDIGVSSFQFDSRSAVSPSARTVRSTCA